MPSRAVGWMVGFAAIFANAAAAQDADSAKHPIFHPLPRLPDPIGVAGPLVGVHQENLIVAGGANFSTADDPRLWSLPKLFHDRVFVMHRDDSGYRWRRDTSALRLDRPIAYSAVVSCSAGILCLGGENADGATARTFLLRLRIDGAAERLEQNTAAVPDLPLPSTAGGAAVVGDHVYVVAGQVTQPDGSTAPSSILWRLPLSSIAAGKAGDKPEQAASWEPLASPTGGPGARTHAIVTSHAGKLFVIGGRRTAPGSDAGDMKNVQFFSDMWSFDPKLYNAEHFDAAEGRYRGRSAWKRELDAPVPMSAGTALPLGGDRIAVLSYADGSRIRQALDAGVAMEDFDHPGFPRLAWIYCVTEQTWSSLPTPGNQVTTPAVQWGSSLFLISGEIRPRVRTARSWRIDESSTDGDGESRGVGATVRD